MTYAESHDEARHPSLSDKMGNVVAHDSNSSANCTFDPTDVYHKLNHFVGGQISQNLFATFRGVEAPYASCINPDGNDIFSSGSS